MKSPHFPGIASSFRPFATWMLLFAVPLCPAESPPSAARFTGKTILVLEEALPDARGDLVLPFNLHLTWESGEIVNAWGESFGAFNTVPHEVHQIESTLTPEGLRLDVEARLRRDMWVEGGIGKWEINLRRIPSDGQVYSLDHNALRTGTALESFEGSFSGVFTRDDASHPSEGSALGIRWAAPGPPQRPPIAHDERPRILMRQTDLPELQERLESDLGQAIARALPETFGPIGPAILYTLTGEEDHAREAAKRTHAEMTDRERISEHETHQSTFWADRALRAAIALDHCYEAWEPEFRAEVIDFITRMSENYLDSPWRSGSAPITRPGNTKADKIYAASGIGMLALRGLPGSPPRPPPESANPGASALQARFGAPEGIDAAARREAYERARAFWEENDGADPRYLNGLEKARRIVSVSLYSAIGEGGSGGMPYLYDFDLAWRNAFGQPVSIRPILSLAATDALFSTLWLPDENGRPSPENLLGSSTALNGAMISRYFASADPELRPAIAWYWLQLAGIANGHLDGPEDAEKLIETMRDDPIALHYALREWPLDDFQVTSPADILPHAFEDKARGDFWFRNAWSGPDDILANLATRQLGSRRPHTRATDPYAGTFRIHGLGHTWVHDGHLPRNQWANPLRYNLVQLPEVHTNNWAQGRVLDYISHPHGASVRLDLSLMYEKHEYVEETAMVTETFRGNLTRERPVTRNVHRLGDIGVDATRIFATDFSGRAGVPAVFALADRLSGDHAKEWQLHVTDLADSEVRVEGNTFHITKGDATLTGTFIAPADVKIEKRLQYTSETFVTIYKDYAYQNYTRDLLIASGPRGNEGEFLLVMTLSEGPESPRVTRITEENPVALINGLQVHFGEKAITFESPTQTP
ncbi:MAG: hypothetical protein JJU29_06305 [Verrucomicrobia bacterium]|nr:hypothetical protein [Verrucomicrobiota bacterium]MCH8511479.1 hypothetical protein [Kiritimatiellia bacterium]